MSIGVLQPAQVADVSMPRTSYELIAKEVVNEAAKELKLQGPEKDGQRPTEGQKIKYRAEVKKRRLTPPSVLFFIATNSVRNKERGQNAINSDVNDSQTHILSV